MSFDITTASTLKETPNVARALSIVSYNVEYRATTPSSDGTLSGVQEKAIHNVGEFLAAEDRSFVVIPEATPTLMEKLCTDTDSSVSPGASIGSWAMPRFSGSKVCGYVHEKTARHGNVAILYKADEFDMTHRTCNVYDVDEYNTDSVERLQKSMCVELTKGMTMGLGRANLLVNFRRRDGTGDILIAGLHVGHHQHYDDLLAFARALTKFSVAVNLSGLHPVVIAGDFNTHLFVKAWNHEVGIHQNWSELTGMGMEVPAVDIVAETWLLHGRNSINQVLREWRRQFGYSRFEDAAEVKFNRAIGETAARGDDGTMGWTWDKPSHGKLNISDLSVYEGGRPLDHILFAVPREWGEDVNTEVYVGLPNMPSSDHVPLILRRLERRAP